MHSWKQARIATHATITQEYVRCGNPDCQNSHGPYLYAYWKHGKKLNKRYVGKNLEDFSTLVPVLQFLVETTYNEKSIGTRIQERGK